MYNLKPSTFMLWVYFADNSNGYKMDLYPVDFCGITGLSASTYARGMKELEEKGYLVRSPRQKNLFLFKERSESEQISAVDLVKSLEGEDFEEEIERLFTQNDCQNEEDSCQSDQISGKGNTQKEYRE